MQMGVMAGKVIYALLDLFRSGLGFLSLTVVLCYLLTAVFAFLAAFLSIRMLRSMAESKGYANFAYYSWGLALFTFVLNLMA